MNAETGRPTTMGILRVLEDAGHGGMLAGYISRCFTRPEDPARRNSWVNTMLHQLRRSGKARRGDHTEPSPYYHNTPSYRWWITPAGRRYLESGGRPGELARARSRRTEAQAERLARARQREAVLERAVTAVAAVPRGCRAARLEVMRGMRADGMSLEEIGAAFGVTRERARQILAGVRFRPCRCPQCVPDPQDCLGRLYLDWEWICRAQDNETAAPPAAGYPLYEPEPPAAGREGHASDIAAVLAVHANTVRNWARRGLIPHSRTSGGHLRLSLEEVRATVGSWRRFRTG